MKNILIIGSNFGFKGHYKSIKNLKFFKVSGIVSPNIFKKKIPNKINKFKNFEKALNTKIIDVVACATLPKYQNEVVDYIIKKKIPIKGLMLEKPISKSIKETLNIIRNLKKNKIPFVVNFIFIKIDVFSKFKKVIKNKKINNYYYKWYFKQSYFINKKKTWKIKMQEGGGIIHYYLIHIFYNIIYLFGNIKFNKIIFFNENKNKILTKIIINGKIQNKNLIIDIDINNKENKHLIIASNSKNTYSIINNSKDWTKNFRIKHNNKIINKGSTENRIVLTKKNYNDLNSLMKKNYFKEDKSVTISHRYCDYIYKKYLNLKL